MLLPAHLSPTILTASLNQIAPLLQKSANTDEQTARNAVTALLGDYNPQTNQELTLAAEIVHYRALAADNMTRSQDPDLPLTKVLRLRSNGVSLSRECHKARRELNKLQAARIAEPVQQDAPPTKQELQALQTARDIISGKTPHKFPTAEQLRKQAMAQKIRDNSARNAALHAQKVAQMAA
jgi:hypothetical protein